MRWELTGSFGPNILADKTVSSPWGRPDFKMLIIITSVTLLSKLPTYLEKSVFLYSEELQKSFEDSLERALKWSFHLTIKQQMIYIKNWENNCLHKIKKINYSMTKIWWEFNLTDSRQICHVRQIFFLPKFFLLR